MAIGRLLVLTAAVLTPIIAAAQPPPSAAAVQEEVQTILNNLVGSQTTVSAPSVRVTQNDDRYEFALVLPGAADGNEITAMLRPLDGGRWSINDITLPSTVRFGLPPPLNGSDTTDFAPRRAVMDIGAQDSHAIFDPLFASPSSLEVNLGDISVAIDGEHEHQEQHIDRYHVQANLQPDGDRLRLAENGEVTGWRVATRVKDEAAVAFGADRISVSGRVDGMNLDHATALFSAVIGLFATMPVDAATTQHGATMPPATRLALRSLIESLRDVAGAIHGEETLDGLHMMVAGQGEASVRQLRLAMDGTAPDGALHGSLDIGIDGIAVQDVPPMVATLVPSHIALRPTVDGISLADLTKLALEATEEGGDPARLAADAEALLSRGDVTFGLDSAGVSLGPANLHGKGHVVLTGPGTFEAEAHISATGIDALIQQARDNPALSKVLPALAVLRGFARPDGDRLVWDIAANPAGLTLNGIELDGGRSENHQPDRR